MYINPDTIICDIITYGDIETTNIRGRLKRRRIRV